MSAIILSGIAHKLHGFNRAVGLAISWLTLAMVLVTVVVVVQRYLFTSGSIRLQESVTFMHAAVFMLAAAYTLGTGEHVRVDIFYSKMSPRRKALVELLGTLLLLVPFCAFLLWASWDYVATSWAIQESSRETGGLPHPFPAVMKSFIPLTAILLMLQGCAATIEAWLLLRSDSSATTEE